MSNKETDTPISLLIWLKCEQEEIEKHKAKIVLKSYREDKEFVRLITFLVQIWPSLKLKEKIMINHFAGAHNSFRCLSVNQRSAITSIYLKYFQEEAFAV